MLDSSDQGQEVTAWIHSLPCTVMVPAKLLDDFEKSGPVPTVIDEMRCSVRFYCRGKNHRAALEVRQNYPAVPRQNEWRAVYATNISKRGCGILHSEPLYPGERFGLVLLTGARRSIEVAWCRRVDKNCFEVGSRFVDSAANDSSESAS
jgi:hypothetical protein